MVSLDYPDKARLLAVIEDIIRTVPPIAAFGVGHALGAAWSGRAAAAIRQWNYLQSPSMSTYLRACLSQYSADGGLHQAITLLHQARYELTLELPNAGNVAVPHGGVFSYFDELRKIIELAKADIFFVDPYLDAEFVPRYLPHIAASASIRLLAREKLKTLLPAIDLFSQEHNRKISVRSAPKFHDRYVLIDGASCYQSGASFKDGAKSAPTTITGIVDAFPAMQKTYEDLWNTAKVER